MNYFKTFEMFDSDELRANHELEYINGILDPKELAKDAPQMIDAVSLNNAILNDLPFYSYSSIITHGDHVSYEFSNKGAKILIGISSEIIGDGRFPTVIKVIKNNGEENILLSKVFDFQQLITYLQDFENQINSVMKIAKVNPSYN